MSLLTLKNQASKARLNWYILNERDTYTTQPWDQQDLQHNIIDYFFVDSSLITDVDHKIIYTCIDISELLANNKAFTQYDKPRDSGRTQINYGKIDKELWAKFQEQLSDSIDINNSSIDELITY